LWFRGIVGGNLRGPDAVEAEYEVADVDLVALAHDGGLRDLPAVYVRAIRALQIRDDEATVAKEKPSVMLGYVAFREHQIVALDAADVDLALVEGLFALRAALLADDDREHSVVPRHDSHEAREWPVTFCMKAAAESTTPKGRDPVRVSPPCIPIRTMAHCVAIVGA
jgi:hypothetical protein